LGIKRLALLLSDKTLDVIFKMLFNLLLKVSLVSNAPVTTQAAFILFMGGKNIFV